jgi:hypothetical protein
MLSSLPSRGDAYRQSGEFGYLLFHPFPDTSGVDSFPKRETSSLKLK